MAQSKRILLGDDHVQTVRTCRAALEGAGFEVVVAGTLEEASRILSDAAPACAVVDAALPGGDVSEFCVRARRALGLGQHLPVLVLVPPRFPPNRLARLRTLCDVCLFKPFHIGELVERVIRLVEVIRRPPRYDTEPETGQGLTLGESSGSEHLGMSGNVIAGCRLERVLGRGATGVVYLGRHLVLDVPVAVKLVPESAARWSREELGRFERGVRAAAKVQHPNVVQVLHAGHEGKLHFLVQRYVAGETLKARIDSQGRLAQGAVLRVLREIAAGLGAVHRLQLVHRDVKPGNIIITPPGAAMLTDFGFARATGLGDISSRSEMIGTPYYMSPEQCDGLALDGRSDLYSLGATAYHALTGSPPIRGDTPVAVLRAHIEQPPRAPNEVVAGVSEALSRILMKLLAKSPDERYPSAEELLADLQIPAADR